jgi:hypothetical protein
MRNKVNTLQPQNQTHVQTATCTQSKSQSSPWIAVSEQLPAPGVEVLFYCLLIDVSYWAPFIAPANMCPPITSFFPRARSGRCPKFRTGRLYRSIRIERWPRWSCL